MRRCCSARSRFPRRPPVPCARVDVLGILLFVHDRKVIHRDIKPSNLIRRESDGKIVLIDFGAVKHIATNINRQNNFTLVGTPGYMPPEQNMGEPHFCSDIYALGMTAIAALTGVEPNHLGRNAQREVVWRDRASVSSGLADILDKIMRYNFVERYQTAQEVLDNLQKLKTGHVLTQVRQLYPHPPESFALKGDFTNLYIGDFNGDGQSDILRQEKGSWDDDAHMTAHVLLSQGNGNFTRSTLPESFLLKGDFTNLYIGDFNGDGQSDILRQEKGSWDDDAHMTAHVLLSQGNGNFTRSTLPESFLLKGDFTNLYIGDFNGDVGTTMPI
ncbi:MAG: hypothetical protein EBE86_001500 [Hormoscilla sp. GUM202]|nr:hypothetical protein [Hormoscilla sp. GUM202]